MKNIITLSLLLLTIISYAQTGKISGKITNSQGLELSEIEVYISDKYKTTSNKNGVYTISNIPYGKYNLSVNTFGYNSFKTNIKLSQSNLKLNITLKEINETLEELVISGTMKEVSKLDSPVPVEVYSSEYFKANPSPSIFEALQNVNGVRPQINCSVCNTGDIHINGLEGPYSMVLIDGMPIVSGLSTVYGLSGIPQALIDRVEVVKGPASTLYGSEAVAGLINIITKKTDQAPIISADVYGTSWGEVNTDLAGKLSIGENVQSIFGINYFNYSNPIDKNKDNFTDVTLQNRFSIFNKWNFERKDNKVFNLAARYVKEDRWGGEMNWDAEKHRGGDEIYGESIYTDRWEFFGNYQLPVEEQIFFQFSANGHKQDSFYGDTAYNADQKVGFGQINWFKTLGKHELLTGASYRYTYFDDDTPATATANDLNKNQPSHTHLPGIFAQDEIKFNSQNTLLLGMRYDYNSLHGSILTPRLNYKWNTEDKKNVVRLSLGNGYRVANVFTEDHQALTGAREVTFLNNLRPETSYNANINYVTKFMVNNVAMGLDATAFYTYFTNKIVADADTDGNKIIYDNLDGNAISKGLSLNLNAYFPSGLKILAGATLMDIYSVENDIKTEELFAENFTGTWNIGYTFKNIGLTIDYTGNVYSPMRLPLVSEKDPRSEYSPWWSIQNIQLTKPIGKHLEVYAGVKNLLNWTPADSEDFIIARSHDPFDKDLQTNNPNNLTFDPGYVYAPNQGIRGFFGVRYSLF